MKNNIQQTGYPVFQYPARWDESKQRLVDLDELGAKIHADLLWSIHNELGLESLKKLDDASEENAAMEAFIAERCEHFWLGSRLTAMKTLDAFTSGENPTQFLVITGTPGLGKSSLLAAFARRHREEHPETAVIVHFTGMSRGSGSLRPSLHRLCRELTDIIGVTADLPEDIGELANAFSRWLNKASESRNVLIILDALNQISPKDNAHTLFWIPDPLPTNTRVIISTTEHPLLEAIRKRKDLISEVNLLPLDEVDMRHLVHEFLDRFKKKMDEGQIFELLSKPESCNPLYLLTALEELRTLGTYETITEYIRELPNGISPLFLWILEVRLAGDPGFVDAAGQPTGAKLVRRLMTLLATSRYGLTTGEITDLVDPGDPLGNVAALLRFLRPHMIRRGDLIDFSHISLRETVRAFYLKEESYSTEAHRELASYFLKHADPDGDQCWTGNNPRSFQELIFHLIQSRNLQKILVIAQSPFLDRVADLLGNMEALSDARDMVILVSEGGKEHWSDLLFCARRYCDFAERFHASPETLEALVKRGELNRVQYVIDSELNAVRRGRLMLAAAAFLFDAGHTKMAHELKDSAIPLLGDNPSDEKIKISYYSSADNFLAYCINEKINSPPQTLSDRHPSSHLKASDTSLPDQSCGNVNSSTKYGTSGQQKSPLPRKTVPFFFVLLMNYVSIKNVMAISFGWIGFQAMIAITLVIIRPDWIDQIASFTRKTSVTTWLEIFVLFGHYLLLIIAWLVLLIPWISRRAESIMAGLLQAIVIAPGPKKLRLFYRAQRFSFVLIKNESIQSDLAKTEADLVLPLLQNQKQAARLIVKSTELGDDIPGRLEPILRRLTPELLNDLYTEVARQKWRMTNPWQLFRLYVATMDMTFNPNLLRIFITTETGSLNPDEERAVEVNTYLMMLPTSYLGRALICSLKPEHHRDSYLIEYIKRSEMFLSHPNQAIYNHLHFAEPIIWCFLFLPFNFSIILGTPLLALAVASFFVWTILFAVSYERYSATFSLSENLLNHQGEIAKDIKFKRLHEKLIDSGRISDTLLANTILSSTQIDPEILIRIPDKRLRHLLVRLCHGRFLRSRGDIVKAVMGNRRLLEIVATMESLPEIKESDNKIDSSTLNEQLHRVLPILPVWWNMIFVFLVSVLIMEGWWKTMHLLDAQFSYILSTKMTLFFLLQFGYLTFVQHLPRGKKRRERKEGVLEGTILGGTSSLVFLFASAYMNKLMFGSQENFSSIMFFFSFMSVLIVNILAPIFMSYWSGTNLLYPGWREMWKQRIIAVTLLAVSCLLLSTITLLFFKPKLIWNLIAKKPKYSTMLSSLSQS